MKIIPQLLDNSGYITVNKQLIKKLGLNEAVFIGELCAEYNYWETQDKLIEGKWFYSTRENIENNTSLSGHTQRKVIEKLQEERILEVQKKGLPAKNYYCIDFDKISQLLMVCITRDKKSTQQETENFNPNNNINKNNKKVFISKDINTTKVGNKNDFIGSAKSQPKQSLYSKCIAYINDFTENKDIREDLIVFLNSLTEMKKLRGLTQFEGIINKLQGKSEAEQLKIIDYSIEHGYATFYELTNNSQYSRGRKIQETGNTHVESFTDEDEKHLREFQAKLRKEGKPVVF